MRVAFGEQAHRRDLGCEQLVLGHQNLQVSRNALVELESRQPGELAQCVHALDLPRRFVDLLLRPRQCVIGFAKRIQDRLLIDQQGLPVLRFCRLDLALDRPESENRAADAGTDQHRAGRAGEQAAEHRAHGADGAGDRDVRVVQRPRGADVGVAGDEVLLGLQHVGTAQQQGRGQVAGDQRCHQLVDGLAARNRPGVAAEQDRDQVLLRGDRLLERRDGGVRLLILRADLRHLALGHGAGLEAQLEHPERAGEVVGRGARDLELLVERAQADVAGRNARHQGQHDTALGLLTGIHLRLRGLAQAPHPAEQVGLPRRAERRLVEREIGVGTRRQRGLPDAARAGPAGVAAVADLRVQLRAGGHHRACELIDTGCSDAHVEVPAQRAVHQLVQYRVAELLPPAGVGDFGRLRVVDAPRRRRFDARPHVVRPERTAAQARGQQRHQRGELACPHLDVLSVNREKWKPGARSCARRPELPALGNRRTTR